MPELLPERASLSTICTKRPVVQAKVQHRFNISYTAVSRSAFCPPFGGPASCVFPMALRSATSAISLFPMVLRNGASRSATLHRRPCQLSLPDGALASISATAPRPATNLIWRRSSPVWLALWRIWAGFANSQLQCAPFMATIHISAHLPCYHLATAART